MPGLRRAGPPYHYHATLSPPIYSIVSFYRPYPQPGSEVFRARLAPPERIPAPPRNRHRRAIAARTYRLRTEDFAGENRRSQDETNDDTGRRTGIDRSNESGKPRRGLPLSSGGESPRTYLTYRIRAARSGRTRHSGCPAAECPRCRPRGSRAYSDRCGTPRSARRFY